MATVTLSIPDDVKKQMDRFPEVKWSEVFRQMIYRKLELFRKLKKRGEL